MLNTNATVATEQLRAYMGGFSKAMPVQNNQNKRNHNMVKLYRVA